MSDIKTIEAFWEVSFTYKCPYCNESINHLDLDDGHEEIYDKFGYPGGAEYVGGVDMECPNCGDIFKIGRTYY